MADRGFCRDCGTPLFFKLLNDQKTWVTGGSLDDPAAAPPRAHYGSEGRLPWAHLAEDLPSERTKPGGLTGKTPPDIQSLQDAAQDAAPRQSRCLKQDGSRSVWLIQRDNGVANIQKRWRLIFRARIL